MRKALHLKMKLEETWLLRNVSVCEHYIIYHPIIWRVLLVFGLTYARQHELHWLDISEHIQFRILQWQSIAAWTDWRHSIWVSCVFRWFTDNPGIITGRPVPTSWLFWWWNVQHMELNLFQSPGLVSEIRCRSIWDVQFLLFTLLNAISSLLLTNLTTTAHWIFFCLCAIHIKLIVYCISMICYRYSVIWSQKPSAQQKSQTLLNMSALLKICASYWATLIFINDKMCNFFICFWATS